MSSQKGTNQGQRERERKRQRRRLCQTCFSQAGPRSHLLSSFKGVVMVTVAGSQGWESVAWFPSGLQCGSWDDGKASQLWVDLSEQARPEFTQPKIEPAHLRFRPCLFRCLSLRRACHYNVGLTCFPGWVLAKVTDRDAGTHRHTVKAEESVAPVAANETRCQPEHWESESSLTVTWDATRLSVEWEY